MNMECIRLFVEESCSWQALLFQTASDVLSVCCFMGLLVGRICEKEPKQWSSGYRWNIFIYLLP